MHYLLVHYTRATAIASDIECCDNFLLQKAFEFYQYAGSSKKYLPI